MTSTPPSSTNADKPKKNKNNKLTRSDRRLIADLDKPLSEAERAMAWSVLDAAAARLNSAVNAADATAESVSPSDTELVVVTPAEQVAEPLQDPDSPGSAAWAAIERYMDSTTREERRAATKQFCDAIDRMP